MNLKIGGGGRLQVYDPKDGQYTKENAKSLNKIDKENLVVLYIFGLDDGSSIIHFPDSNIHDREYCELFVKYIRASIRNVDVTIEKPKMTYLITKKVDSDKSEFLKFLGYSSDNLDELCDDIRWNTDFKTLKFKCINQHTFNVEAKTKIKGYVVTTGWQINKDGTIRFLTLVPGGDKKWK